MKKLLITTILFFLLGVTNVHASVVNQSIKTISDGLVGWWTFDGNDLVKNVADRSGNNSTGYFTNINATSSVVVSGKIGQGLKLDGIDDRITIGSGLSSMDISGDLTLSAWIKTKVVNTSVDGIVSNTNGSGNNFEWALEINRTSGKLSFVQGSAANGFAIFTSNTALSVGKWYHVVAVRTGSAGAWTISFYLNGVADGSPTDTENPGANSNTWIGNEQITTTRLFNGSIDDVRVYNRALSASEVKQLYNLGSAKVNQSIVGNNSGLVGWWTFDGKDLVRNVADKSGQNNNGYMQNFGATSTAQATGKIGQGLKFDGVNDYVSVGTVGDMYMREDQPITISAWIKPKSLGPNSTGEIITRGGDSNGPYFTMYTGNTLFFAVPGVTQLYRVSTTNSIKLNQWQHVVVTWDGSVMSSNIHFYVNGSNKDSATKQDGVSPVDNSAQILYIGNRSSYNRSFDGTLDDARIYNRALSASEVKQLYNLGSAKVNQSIIGNSSGLVGWWTFDGVDLKTNVADRSGAGNNGMLKFGTTGNTSTSSMQVSGKIGQGMRFDGVDDYVSISNNIDVANLSYCAWTKHPKKVPTTNEGIIAKYSVNGSYVAKLYICSNPAGNVCFQTSSSGYGNSGNIADQTFSILDDKWHYVCGVYDNIYNRVYIDGNLVASVDRSTDELKSVNTPTLIGAQSISANFFPGNIDDPRIYSRALSASEIIQLYNMGR